MCNARRWSTSFLLIIAVSGCIRTDTIRYTTTTGHSPKPVEAVAVLPGPPSWPYEVLARLALNASPLRSMESIVEDARRQAAEMGADAIIVLDAGRHQAGVAVVPGSSATTGSSSTTGSAFITPGGTSAFGQSTTSGQTTTYYSPSFGVPIMRKHLVIDAIVRKQAPDGDRP